LVCCTETNLAALLWTVLQQNGPIFEGLENHFAKTIDTGFIRDKFSNCSSENYKS
jgi:hypothetical protein